MCPWVQTNSLAYIVSGADHSLIANDRPRRYQVVGSAEGPLLNQDPSSVAITDLYIYSFLSSPIRLSRRATTRQDISHPISVTRLVQPSE